MAHASCSYVPTSPLLTRQTWSEPLSSSPSSRCLQPVSSWRSRRLLYHGSLSTSSSIKHVKMSQHRGPEDAARSDVSSTLVQTPVSLLKLNLPPEFILLTAAGVIGSGAGLCVTAFKLSIEHLQSILYGDAVAGPLFAIFGGSNIAIIPALGGIAVGCLRALSGHPFTGGLSDCVADPTARIGFVKPFQKFLAAVLTLSSGASLGPEQGSVDIGAICGQWVGQVLGINPARRQLLLAAGAASGLAAGFNAPFAGVFFALERLRIGQRVGSGGVDAAVVLLSSSLSAIVAQAGLGATPAFEPPVYDLKDPLLELPMWLAMGGLCGGASLAFRSLLRATDAFFNTSEIMRELPSSLLPVVGASICGLTALVFPQILFFGYATLSSLLADNGDFSLTTLLLLLVMKPLATAICLACGLVGGTVAPSLFLGAVVGACFQKMSLTMLTALDHSGFASFTAGISITGAPAYSMIGMAAVLGGILRAPLTSSLLLFELTRDYRITVASIVAAGISSAIANFDGEDVSLSDSDEPRAPVVHSKTNLSSSSSIANDGLVNAKGKTGESLSHAKPPFKQKLYDDTDKAIELGRPLRTNLEIILEEVLVADPELLSAAPILTETVSLLDVVRSLLQTNSTAAIIVEATSKTNLPAEKTNCTDELVGIITLIQAEEALHAAPQNAQYIVCGNMCEADCVTVTERSSALIALDAMQRAGASQAVVVACKEGTNERHRTGIVGLVTVADIEKVAAVKALKRTLSQL